MFTNSSSRRLQIQEWTKRQFRERLALEMLEDRHLLASVSLFDTNSESDIQVIDSAIPWPDEVALGVPDLDQALAELKEFFQGIDPDDRLDLSGEGASSPQLRVFQATDDGFTTLVGATFHLANSDDRTQIIGVDVDAFVGFENEQAGIVLNDATLGMVAFPDNDQYALSATGTATLQGVDNVRITQTAGQADAPTMTLHSRSRLEVTTTISHDRESVDIFATADTALHAISGDVIVEAVGDDGQIATQLSDEDGDLSITKNTDALEIEAADAVFGLFQDSKQVLGFYGSSPEDTHQFQIAAPTDGVSAAFEMTGVFHPDSFDVGFGGIQNPLRQSPGSQVTIGPMKFGAFGPSLQNLSIVDGTIGVDVGVAGSSITLAYGPMNRKASAVLTDFTGGFTIAGPLAEAVPTGGFAFTANQLDLAIPNVLVGEGVGISLAYDPQSDLDQELFSIDFLEVTVDLPVPGNVDPMDGQKRAIQGRLAKNGDQKAFTVWGDGFQLGNGRIQVEDTFRLGSFVSIVNPWFEITNFTYGHGHQLSAPEALTIGAGSTGISFADQFNSELTNFSAQLRFDENSVPIGFTFVGDFSFSFGSYLSVEGIGIEFTPTAGDDEYFAKIGTLAASLRIPLSDISLSASTKNLNMFGDGQLEFATGFGFSVAVGEDAQDPSKPSAGKVANALKWPSFMPVRKLALGLEWPDLQADPTDFLIDLTIEDVGISIGEKLKLEGGFTGVKIDVGHLTSSPPKFPITDLSSAKIGAAGNLFGTTFSGFLDIGIVKVDEDGVVLPPNAAPSQVDDRIFYAAATGTLLFAKKGFDFRMGVSSKGPLQGYLAINAPIVLEPTSGLALGDFRGGITFNSTPLPEIDDAEDLRRSTLFQPTGELTEDEWRTQMRLQVANQVRGNGGYVFTIDQSINDRMSDLNSGRFGGELGDAFANGGYPLSKVPGIVSVSVVSREGQWLIEDRGKQFLVERAGASPNFILNVFKVRTTISDSNNQLVPQLNNEGAVPAALQGAFYDAGLHLTDNATVVVKEPNDKWIVTQPVNGDEVEYVVQLKGRGPSALLTVVGGESGGFGDLLRPLGFGDETEEITDVLDQLLGVIKIEAGATLYSVYVPQNVFSLEADLVLTSTGQILLQGDLVVGEELVQGLNLTTRATLFGDFSRIAKGIPDVSFHYLLDFPTPGKQIDFLPIDLSDPVLTTAGTVSFGVLNGDGTAVDRSRLPDVLSVENLNDLVDESFGGLEFRFDGIARVGLPQFAAIEVRGNSTLRVLATNESPFPSLTLALDGNLSIIGLINAELVKAEGFFALEFLTESPVVNAWGTLSFNATTDNLPFLGEAGIDVGGNVLLMMNSTNVEKVEGMDFPELTNDLPDNAKDAGKLVLAPDSFSFLATQSLTIDVSPGNQLELAGTFAAEVIFSTGAENDFINVDGTEQELDFRINLFVLGGFQFDVFDQTILDFEVVGLLSYGLRAQTNVADLDFELSGGGIAGMLSVKRKLDADLIEFDVDFEMLLNTTFEDVSYQIPQRAVIPNMGDRLGSIYETGQVTIPKGPPGREAVADAYLHMAGDGMISFLDVFRLEGEFELDIAASTGLMLTADATLRIELREEEDAVITGDYTFLNVHADGELTINDQGFHGRMSVATDSRSIGDLASLEGTYHFEVDTIAAEPYARLAVEGELALLKAFDLEGRFMVQASNSEVRLDFDDVSIGLFDHAGGLTVNGYATLIAPENGFLPGIRANATIEFSQFGVQEVVEIDSANLTLQIDTFADQFLVDMQDVKIDVFEVGGAPPAFTLRGSGNIASDGDTWDLSLSNVSAQVLGLGADLSNLTLDHFVASSQGDFNVSLDGMFDIDGYGGSFDVSIGYLDGVISAYGNADVQFGPFTGDANMKYRSDSGKIEADVCAEFDFDLFGVEICIEGISLNFIKLPVFSSVQPAPARTEGSTLVLNTGFDAHLRTFDPHDGPEIVTIKPVDRMFRDEQSVRVTIVSGRNARETKVYHGITSIEGYLGNGDDRLEIHSEVEIPTSINGGLGNDTMLGGSGADRLDGFLGNDRIEGGAGNDVLVGFHGNDHVLGGPGNDQLFGGIGDDQLDGEEGRDALRGESGNDILWATVEDVAVDGGDADYSLFTRSNAARKNGVPYYATGDLVHLSIEDLRSNPSHFSSLRITEDGVRFTRPGDVFESFIRLTDYDSLRLNVSTPNTRVRTYIPNSSANIELTIDAIATETYLGATDRSSSVTLNLPDAPNDENHVYVGRVDANAARVVRTTASLLTVNGGAGVDYVHIDDRDATHTDRTISLHSDHVVGFGRVDAFNEENPIFWSDVEFLDVTGSANNDIISIHSIGPETTVTGGGGNDEIIIHPYQGTLHVDGDGTGESGANTVTVVIPGDPANGFPADPAKMLNFSRGIVDNRQWHGDVAWSIDSVNGPRVPSGGFLPDFGVEEFELLAGSGDDTITAGRTRSDGPFSVNAGEGNDTVIVEEADGFIQISDSSGDDDTLIVEPRITMGHLGNDGGRLDAFELGAGFENFDVKLSDSGSDFTIDKAPGWINLTSGTGDDVIRVVQAGGKATIVDGGGDNLLDLGHMNGGIQLSTGDGVDHVTLRGRLGGMVSVDTGGGFDELNIDRSFEHVPRIVSFSPQRLSGLDVDDVAYSNTELFSLTLGQGADTLDILQTAANMSTVFSGGGGFDDIHVSPNLGLIAGDTTIMGGTGDDVIRLTTNGVNLTSATPTVVTGNSGFDTLHVSLQQAESAASFSNLPNQIVVESESFGQLKVNRPDAFDENWQWRDGEIIVDGTTILNTAPILKTEINAGPNQTDVGDSLDIVHTAKSVGIVNHDETRFRIGEPGSLAMVGFSELDGIQDLAILEPDPNWMQYYEGPSRDYLCFVHPNTGDSECDSRYASDSPIFVYAVGRDDRGRSVITAYRRTLDQDVGSLEPIGAYVSGEDGVPELGNVESLEVAPWLDSEDSKIHLRYNLMTAARNGDSLGVATVFALNLDGTLDVSATATRADLPYEPLLVGINDNNPAPPPELLTSPVSLIGTSQLDGTPIGLEGDDWFHVSGSLLRMAYANRFPHDGYYYDNPGFWGPRTWSTTDGETTNGSYAGFESDVFCFVNGADIQRCMDALLVKTENGEVVKLPYFDLKDGPSVVHHGLSADDHEFLDTVEPRARADVQEQTGLFVSGFAPKSFVDDVLTQQPWWVERQNESYLAALTNFAGGVRLEEDQALPCQPEPNSYRFCIQFDSAIRDVEIGRSARGDDPRWTGRNSKDATWIYVLTETGVVKFSYDQDFTSGLLGNRSSSGKRLTTQIANNGEHSSMTISPDRQHLYLTNTTTSQIDVYRVLPSEVTINPDLFRIVHTGGDLEYVGSYSDGLEAGPITLAISRDGKKALATTPNGLVIYDRDIETGSLTIRQTIENQIDASGISKVTEIVGLSDGTFLTLNKSVDQPGIGLFRTDVTRDVKYVDVERQLRLVTGPFPDSIAITDAGVELPLVIDTQDGDDLLTVQHTSAGAQIHLNAGLGADTLEILATAEDVNITGDTHAGDDDVRVFSVGSTSVIALNGGSEQDDFYVVGAQIPASSTVSFTGNSPDVFPGDTFTFDRKGQGVIGIVSDSLTSLSGSISGTARVQFSDGTTSGVVSYNGIETPPIESIGPTVLLTDSVTISEGDALDVSAMVVAGDSPVTGYAWDINGDGDYRDATGSNVKLSWVELRRLGIDDNGHHLMSVRVIDQAGNMDVTTSNFNVLNSPPRLELIGLANGSPGVDYSVIFSASDPGNDMVSEVEIDWGDGSSSERFDYSDQPITMTHNYRAVGEYALTVIARDEDSVFAGDYLVNKQVDILIPQLNAGGPYRIDEGNDLPLNAVSDVSTTNARWTWDLNQDGIYGDAAGASPVVQFSRLHELGMGDDGVYTVTAVLLLDDSVVATASAALHISNVDPTLSIVAEPSVLVDEAFVIYTEARDPGDDAISEWTIDWGDGSLPDNCGRVPQLTCPDVMVFSHEYTSPGDFTISVRAIDDDGEYLSTHSVNVVLPDSRTESVSGPRSMDEGSIYDLTLTPPLPLPADLRWRIDWGDGSQDDANLDTTLVQHRYADDGIFAVESSLVDASGNTVGTPITIDLIVQDVAPDLRLPVASESTEFVLPLQAIDPGDDRVSSWVIDWGDNSPIESFDGTATVATHTYIQSHAGLPFRARIVNEDGTFTISRELMVHDIPPTLDVAPVADPVVGWQRQDPTRPGTFTLQPITTLGEPTDLIPIDFDDDGDLDLLTASKENHRIAWHENDGGLNPTFSEHLIITDIRRPRSLAVLDMDNDGDSDIFVVPALSSDLFWLENLAGDQSNFVVREFAPSFQPAGDFDNIATGDVIDNNMPDQVELLLSSGADTYFFAYEELTRQWRYDGAEQEDGTRVLVDLNGDQKIDRITSSLFIDAGEQRAAALIWHPQDVFPRRQSVSVGRADSIQYDAGDLDNDGDHDIIFVTQRDNPCADFCGVRVGWLENDGNPDAQLRDFELGLISTDFADENFHRHVAQVEIADMNRDGNQDVVVLIDETTQSRLIWLENPGDMDLPFAMHLLGTFDQSISELQTVDLDADGSEDLLLSPFFPKLTTELVVLANEGSVLQIDLRYEDAADPNQRWTIDWGDGTSDNLPGDARIASHVYADDCIQGICSPFPIQIEATSAEGTYSVVTPVMADIADVRPAAELFGASRLDEGMSLNLRLLDIVDPGDDPIAHYEIDWGDGTQEVFDTCHVDGIDCNSGSFDHVYSDDGDYTVSLSLVEEFILDGQLQTLRHSNVATHQVTVDNVLPTSELRGPSTARQYNTYHGEFSELIDPGDDTSRVNIQIYPGPSIANREVDVDSRSFTFIPTASGQYIITLRATDEDGPHVLDRLLVDVEANSVPELNIISSTTEVDEGSPFVFSFEDPIDPITGLPIDATFDVTFGDTGQTFSFDEPQTLTHTFADGDDRFRIVVNADPMDDVDYRGFQGNVFVEVKNVAPTITGVVEEIRATVGQPITVSGLATDPGDDVLNGRIIWGDNESWTDIPIDDDGSFSVTTNYDAPGTYEATLQVYDDDQGNDHRLIVIQVDPSEESRIANWDGNLPIGNNGDSVWWNDPNNWTTNGQLDTLPSQGDSIVFGDGNALLPVLLDSDKRVADLTFHESLVVGLDSSYASIRIADEAESVDLPETTNGDVVSGTVSFSPGGHYIATFEANAANPFRGETLLFQLILHNGRLGLGVPLVHAFEDVNPTSRIAFQGFSPQLLQWQNGDPISADILVFGKLGEDQISVDMNAELGRTHAIEVGTGRVAIEQEEDLVVLNVDITNDTPIVKTGPGALAVNSNVGGKVDGDRIDVGFEVWEGTVTGQGTVVGKLVVAEDATLAPGSTIGSGVGEFSMIQPDDEANVAAEIHGTLEVGIRGSSSDRLVVDGPIHLHPHSKLRIKGIRNLVGYGTQQVQIVDSRGLTGTFGTEPQPGEHYGNGLFVFSQRPVHYTKEGVFVDVFSALPGDVDGDGEVNFEDFLALSNNFGRLDATWSDCDFNADGAVTFSDFLVLAGNFGKHVR